MERREIAKSKSTSCGSVDRSKSHPQRGCRVKDVSFSIVIIYLKWPDAIGMVKEGSPYTGCA